MQYKLSPKLAAFLMALFVLVTNIVPAFAQEGQEEYNESPSVEQQTVDSSEKGTDADDEGLDAGAGEDTVPSDSKENSADDVDAIASAVAVTFSAFSSEDTGAVRFGVISDTHVTQSKSTEQQRLAQMFQFYSEMDLDAVAVVGDLTDNGTTSEMNTWKDIKEEYLEVPLVASMGNHEGIYVGNFENATGNKANDVKIINGYYFITVSPGSLGLNETTGRATVHGGSRYSYAVDWLEKQIADAEAADPDKPIFVFFHHPIRYTFYVSDEWYGSGLETVFENHPRIVSFSGHIHSPNNIPTSIWQDGGYTAINTVTLSYMEVEKGKIYGSVPPNASNVAQGLLVEVEDSEVTIRNYDLISGEWIDQTWTFDVTEELPYTAETREPEAVAPVFPENAEVAVSNITETTALITFDQAEIPENSVGDIVHSYRYDFVNTATGNVDRTFLTFSEFYFIPMPGQISQTADQLQEGIEYELRIYAIDAWDKVSENFLTATFTTGGEVVDDTLTFEDMLEGIPAADMLDVDFAGGAIADHSSHDRTFTRQGGGDGSNIVYNEELGKHVAEFTGSTGDAFKTPWSTEDYSQINTSMSIETVLRVDPFTGSYVNPVANMQSAGIGFEIYPGSNGKADLSIWVHTNGSYKVPQANAVLNYGEWYHVAATYDGNNVVLYLNGQRVAAASCTGTITTPGSASRYYVIGGDVNSSGNVEAPMVGGISTARIYSEALTAKQVRMLANRELPSIDDIAPEIRLESEPVSNASVGDILIVPAAQAADNSSRVTLTMTVYNPNGKDIASDGGSSKTAEMSISADLEGIYEIVYTAVDGAGNRTEHRYEVAVAGGGSGDVEVESIRINASAMVTMRLGDVQEFEVIVTPTDATGAEITWTSSNNSVASVDEDGTVSAAAPGTATLTARSANGKTSTIVIRVTA